MSQTRELLDKLWEPWTLLVFGNGLDIHCGLNSRFKDFFDYKFKDKHGQLLVDEIKNNLWYLIFTYAFMLDKDYGGKLVPFIDKKDPLWMDVENHIDSVFAEANGGIASSLLYIHLFNCFTNKTIQVSNNTGVNFGDDQNQKALLQNRVIAIKDLFDNNFGDLLLSELKAFEDDFTEYLKSELNSKKSLYEKNVTDFFNKVQEISGDLNPFILSFNYTPSFDPFYCGQENVINIHGSLQDNNIIIGIGEKNNRKGLTGRSDLTKTERRIKEDLDSLVFQDECIEKIIFYGCSFSDQDKFYYDHIFERFKLESTGDEKKFIFLYSDYAGSDRENKKNRDSYFNRCKKVVDNYLARKVGTSSFNFKSLHAMGKIEFKPI